tara:strand:+ start:273 stop:788 length:516 start_codon:yes stop_codon:yes gene_type:complete
MRILVLIFLLPLCSTGQSDLLQTFGTVSHYEIYCPCKLLKYYENGKMFYNCYDNSEDVEFTIKEFKYLDGLDLLIKKLDKNIYKNKKQIDKSNDETVLINDYLSKNPQGSIINIEDFKFVKVIDDFEKKFFFVDKNLAASFEIILQPYKRNDLGELLDKTIESVKPKKIKF